MSRNQKRAVVLLSGGLDSATRSPSRKTTAMQFTPCRFNTASATPSNWTAQKNGAKSSRQAACHHANRPGRVRRIGPHQRRLQVPKGRNVQAMNESIPITYVPARNTIFLSFALAWAEVLNCSDIFIGVNALDYSGYPDCRPEYIAAYERMANLATRAGVEGRQKLSIHTPLIALTKAQIIRRGIELGVDYAMTSTCYDPAAGRKACGACDACILRLKGFAENGIPDPAAYVASSHGGP